MKENILKQIISALSYQEDFLSSQDLSFIVGVSDRTIRYEINRHRSLLSDYGLNIISKPKLGYKLKVESNTRAVEFMKNIDFLVTRQVGDVKYYILTDLLLNSDFLVIDDLAEQYYVSRSTVYRIVKQIEEIIAPYELHLESVSNKGIKIVGIRRNRLRCLKGECLNALLELRNMTLAEYQEIKSEITILVFKSLDQVDFLITESNGNDLIIHIMLMLELNERGIAATSSEYWDLKESSMLAARNICGSLEKKFNILISEDNLVYIAVHLQAKELVKDYSNSSDTYVKVINNIVSKIYHELGYNFLEDHELLDDLRLHFEPMMFRLNNRIDVDDTLISDIKINLFEGFECALIAAHVIQEMYGLYLSEAEIALIALHFGVAIERLLEDKEKQVLLITSAAIGIVSLLKKRAARDLSLMEDGISIASFAEALTMNLEEFDQVYSTIPFADKLNNEIIYIENPLTFDFLPYQKRDELAIDFEHFFTKKDFYNLKGIEKKEDVFDFLLKELEEEYFDNRDLVQSAIKRESFASTEMINSIALPHPLIRSDKTIIKVIVLDEKILWDDKKIQIIIFISHSKNKIEQERALNNKLTKFVLSFNKVMDLLKNPTYNNFVDLIV